MYFRYCIKSTRNMNPSNLQVTIVAGNIGSGKSTTLESLKSIASSDVSSATEFHFILEDVERWHHYLEKMYLYPNEDKYRWLLQCDVLGHFLQVAKAYDQLCVKALNEPSKQFRLVIERSPQEVLAIFLKQEDRTHDDETLINMYKCLIEKTNLWSNPKMLNWVWVQCPLEKVYQRVSKRNRPGEKEGVSTDFLAQLDKRYLTFFTTVSDTVITLDNSTNDVAALYTSLVAFYRSHLL
uniref:Deoxycytidine kinase n=1 Tax=Clandestinovirus TaxID=2831644 RepID=A0A8F8PM90_9VIRU|nr:deoxycytidine kinase [Clandestinovirus]